MTKITAFFMVMTVASINVFAADATPEVMGTWKLNRTACVNKNQPEKAARIMKWEWLGFEPSVQLKVYQKDGKQYIQKEVVGDSCRALALKTEYFMKATHEVQINSKVINHEVLHDVKGIQLLDDHEVKGEEMRKCGNTIQGLTTFGLAWIAFPKHFQAETNRAYQMVIRNSQLLLKFQDPNICDEGATVMIFDRK